MIISAEQYRDKVYGCWLGKNIGGTLGAPFECKRGVFEIDWYVQDLSQGALPNDDLDLQLIWLNAAEKYGRSVDSLILAEYWLSGIVANWSEYGAGKNNLAAGLPPPISGWFNNHNRDSCGAFIRSEIWACIAPGHPEIAVEYALRDARVDHSNEGVYAEVFSAAVQSAAFTTGNADELIDIGLSYIPPDCGVAKAVLTARNCYAKGLDWKAARKAVLNATPGSFGMYNGYQDREPEPDVPVGEPGYDAPSNIGIMTIGWLYGGGDFGRSICIAAGCCEDGDCTAATLGAILGIVSGGNGLPQKWLEPLGDGIKTISIDMTDHSLSIPRTVTELTDRVCALAPVFLGRYCNSMKPGGAELTLNEGGALKHKRERFGTFSNTGFDERLAEQPLGIPQENAIISVTVICGDGIAAVDGHGMEFEIRIKNKLRKQQWLMCRWILPDSWEASTGREFAVNLDQPGGGFGMASVKAVITPHDVTSAMYDARLEIRSIGRPSLLSMPIVIVNTPHSVR